MFNSFGLLYKFTTWGESHGPALGVVIDGIPADFKLNLKEIQKELDRRKPKHRKEPDKFEVLSGIYKGKTTGSPLAFLIRNKDAKPEDYKKLLNLFRPGTADYTYYKKYGSLLPGGGRASGRETVCRVIAGAVAKQFLKKKGISISGIILRETENQETLKRLVADSLGGSIEVTARGVPVGLGEPIYEKLSARLAFAVMSIGSIKAVEIGEGCEVAWSTGYQNNDQMGAKGFMTNHCGGILGGISTGQEIIVRAAVKPIPSIISPQKTITLKGKETTVSVGGRHDVYLPPRVLPVMEAMVACVIFDLLLLSKIRRPK